MSSSGVAFPAFRTLLILNQQQPIPTKYTSKTMLDQPSQHRRSSRASFTRRPPTRTVSHERWTPRPPPAPLIQRHHLMLLVGMTAFTLSASYYYMFVRAMRSREDSMNTLRTRASMAPTTPTNPGTTTFIGSSSAHTQPSTYSTIPMTKAAVLPSHEISSATRNESSDSQSLVGSTNATQAVVPSTTTTITEQGSEDASSSLSSTAQSTPQPPSSHQQSIAAKATIAYLTSVTDCPLEQRQNLINAAAVLQHSIHRTSIRASQSSSAYDYSMYAFVHPNATACVAPLEQIGYTVLVRDTPVQLEQVQNEEYRQRLANPRAGCCQEKGTTLYLHSMTGFPTT